MSHESSKHLTINDIDALLPRLRDSLCQCKEKADDLNIARRAALRLTKEIDNEGDWMDRFAKKAQWLEFIGKFQVPVDHYKDGCNRELDELERELMREGESSLWAL